MPTSRLKRYVVPINLIVLGENELDAMEYAIAAADHLMLHHEEGIIAYDDEIDIEDIFEQER